MLTLYIADAEKDVSMKNLSQKEAITLLRNLEDSLDFYCGLNEEGKTAFRMAIEALSCSEIPNNSDTISRQQAIGEAERWLYDGDDNRTIGEMLRDLPTVQLGTNLAEVGMNLATKRTVKGFPIDADLLMLIAEEKYGFRARDRLYEIIRYMPKYELSPAQPERKTGRWIYRKELSKYSDMWSCSECNEKTTDSIMGKPRPNFCPLCGADMRGEQDG